MSQEDDPCGKKAYQIGAVANLTGLHPDTIRAWERRYGAIEPGRHEGRQRLYSEDDIVRLKLLKALTDAGQRIGTVAELEDEELREQLGRLAGLGAEKAAAVETGAAEPGSAPRVAALSTAISAQAREREFQRLRLVCAAADLDTFVAAVGEARADLLLLDLNLLEGASAGDAVAACDACIGAARARLVVVIYDFARRPDLDRLASRGVKLVQGPLHLDQLERTVYDLFLIHQVIRRPMDSGVAEEGAAAPRRFSDAQLAHLSEISSSIDCECPNHLASIISSLIAFEAYSRQCENRDEKDAALHAFLGRETGRAREIMEDVLERVCEIDGIVL